MVRIIGVSGMKTSLADRVNIFGVMVESIVANGRLIRCMAREFTPGKMVEHIWAATSLIKSMDMASTPGPMDESSRESG